MGSGQRFAIGRPKLPNVPSEVCEMALAHAVTNKTEAAYRRGDLFEKRRALMEAWSGFLTEPKASNVVQLKAVAK